jgi:hypothetical protein
MPACDRRCSKAQGAEAGGRVAVLFVNKKNQKNFVTLGMGRQRAATTPKRPGTIKSRH